MILSLKAECFGLILVRLMNVWAFVRIVLVCGIGSWTYFWTAHLPAPLTLPWWSLVLYLCFPPLLLPFIAGAWVFGSNIQLRRPSLRRNPFIATDPLENAHLAAYCGFACGIIWLSYALISSEHPPLSRAPLPIVLFVAGLGCWFGVRLCLILFRSHLKA